MVLRLNYGYCQYTAIRTTVPNRYMIIRKGMAAVEVQNKQQIAFLESNNLILLIS